MLKNLALAFIVLAVSGSANADIEWIGFTFQFGASTLDVDGEKAYGSGWSATTELHTVPKKKGFLLNVGSSSVEADSGKFFGKEFDRLEIQNRFIQPGAFFYPLKGFRVAAGPSFNWINQDVRYGDGSDEEASASFGGPFFNLAYRLPLDTAVLGAQYNYVSFGNYVQSDLFFLIGLSF